MKTFPSRQTQAFSLVELTLALGVAAFCLISLFGLLPVGMASNRRSMEQTVATGIASSVLGDLRSTPVGTAARLSPQYAFPVPASPTDALKHTLFVCDDGTAAGAMDADGDGTKNPRYRVTVAFSPPASGQRGATGVCVLVTWPALADAKASVYPSKFAGSVEVNTALDRH